MNQSGVDRTYGRNIFDVTCKGILGWLVLIKMDGRFCWSYCLHVASGKLGSDIPMPMRPHLRHLRLTAVTFQPSIQYQLTCLSFPLTRCVQEPEGFHHLSAPGQAGIEHYRLVNATTHYVQDRPSCVAVRSIHSYLDSTLVALAISEHTHHTHTPSALFHPASSPSQVNRSHMRGSTVLFI